MLVQCPLSSIENTNRNGEKCWWNPWAPLRYLIFVYDEDTPWIQIANSLHVKNRLAFEFLYSFTMWATSTSALLIAIDKVKFHSCKFYRCSLSSFYYEECIGKEDVFLLQPSTDTCDAFAKNKKENLIV